MKYFLDTEFVEDGETIMPISLALVREDGRELYIEFKHDEDKARAHDFVRENVLPHLRGQEQYTREEAQRVIKSFMGLDRPPMGIPRRNSGKGIEVWAYFADYDWVLFCQVFGPMVDLPEGCPMFCMDLMQWWTQLGRPDGVKPPHGPRFTTLSRTPIGTGRSTQTWKNMKQRKHRIVIVELPPQPECPACGCHGPHFCVGRRDYESVAFVGVRRPIHEQGSRPFPP